jgi:hypothetical protein
MLKKIYYTILIIIIVPVAFLVATSILGNSFYGYKQRSYHHEIDSLFHRNIIDQVLISKVLSSGKRGSIFYGNIGYTKLLIIESSNFNIDNLTEIHIRKWKQIDRKDLKTYLIITEPKYPDIEQILNPPKSLYCNLLIQDTSCTYIEKKQLNYYYLKGNMQRIAFTNSLNCCTVYFSQRESNEILVIKKGGMLYSIIQLDTLRKFSNIINPKYFKGPF